MKPSNFSERKIMVEAKTNLFALVISSIDDTPIDTKKLNDRLYMCNTPRETLLELNQFCSEVELSTIEMCDVFGVMEILINFTFDLMILDAMHTHSNLQQDDIAPILVVQ